jgi:hypothetical protein
VDPLNANSGLKGESAAGCRQRRQGLEKREKRKEKREKRKEKRRINQAKESFCSAR